VGLDRWVIGKLGFDLLDFLQDIGPDIGSIDLLQYSLHKPPKLKCPRASMLKFAYNGEVMPFTYWAPFAPLLMFPRGRKLAIVDLFLKRVWILAKEHVFHHYIDNVANAANPALLPVESQLTAEYFHSCFIIRRVVQREVAQLVLNLEFPDDIEYLTGDVLACMPAKQLWKAKNALPGPVIQTPEYACNAVKSMPVAGPPSIKLDMNLAWALPKCLSYSQLIRIELSYSDRAHRYIGYVSFCNGN
jgi:hypothetical protein